MTIHTEHRRAQTRSLQRCKKVSPRLDERLWKNARGQLARTGALCGDSRGRGSKTEDFLRFLACASAEIRVVEVQRLWTFYDF